MKYARRYINVSIAGLIQKEARTFSHHLSRSIFNKAKNISKLSQICVLEQIFAAGDGSFVGALSRNGINKQEK